MKIIDLKKLIDKTLLKNTKIKIYYNYLIIYKY